MKHPKALVVILVVTAVLTLGYRARATQTSTPVASRMQVETGDVVQTVTATGTLAAVHTVLVGAQVSGLVTKLHADFNAIVKKGDVLAEIDPQKAKTQVVLAEAARKQAADALESDQDQRGADALYSSRMESLAADQQVTQEDLETARFAVRQDDGKLQEDAAAVAVDDAQIAAAKNTLEHCIIDAPMDAIVVARDVDEGQTVNASIESPALYELASDLTQMEIIGAVDEADVAQVHAGQSVRFTVETYPGVTFRGTVTQVRLDPSSVNNVVTYQTVIAAPNADLRLLPGMTAHFAIEVAHARNAVRVPVAALRFRPTAAAVQLFPQTVVPAATVVSPASAGTVWEDRGARLVPVAVTLGVSDGTWVEVVSGDVKAGDNVITVVAVPGSAPAVAAGGNPFAPAAAGSTRPRGGM